MIISEFIRVCQRRLIELYPELESMVFSLENTNPDYYEIVSEPAFIISALCDSEETLDEALRGYIRFCDTFKQKQLEFARLDAYAHKDFETVNIDVYQNQEYMIQTYYPALLFSYLFSSNYFEILRVFKNSFLPYVEAFSNGKLLEIGIGHGLLSGLLVKRYPFISAQGIDISPSSPVMVKKINQVLNIPFEDVIISDATLEIKQIENTVGICAEVLEHLQNPEALLRNIYNALKSGGLLFLTASINMESVDHLYLFKSDEEVVQLVNQVGFKVVERHLAFLTTSDYRNNSKVKARLQKLNNPSTSILILKK